MKSSIYDNGTYKTRNVDWHTGDSAWKARQIGAILKDNRVPFLTLADVGCGAGRITESLAKQFPESVCHGFDTSKDAAAFWPVHSAEVQFHNDDFLTSGQRFDLVLNIDVFEHIEDYLGFLKRQSHLGTYFVFHIPLEMHVSAILRDALETPRRLVGHLHHFSRQTALLTLDDAGYEVLDVRFTRLSQETIEGRTAKTAFLNVARRLVGVVSESLSAKLFGGYSLLVLARALVQGSEGK